MTKTMIGSAPAYVGCSDTGGLALTSGERAEARARPSTARSEKRVPSSTVRGLCGGISDMTLWRWLNDPEMGFPRPIYIARRRYWREADVIAWLEAQTSEVPA